MANKFLSYKASLVVISHGSFLAFGAVSNCAAILILICCSGKKWAAQEVIAVNLYIANGLFSVFYNSVTIINEFSPSCLMGRIPCKILQLAYIEPSVVSIWVTCMLSVFWWLKLYPVGPFSRVALQRPWIAPAVLAATWVFWYLLLLPLLFFETRLNVNNSISSQCLCLAPSTAAGFTYQYVTVTMGVMVPVAILVVSNSCIIRAIMRHRSRVHQDGSIQQNRSGAHFQAAKNVLVLTIFFGICWCVHTSTYALMNANLNMLKIMLRSSATNLYSILSPIILCWGNRHFRELCWRLWLRLGNNAAVVVRDD